MELQVIAHAVNRFVDKFGIPRQSREQSIIETRIVFTPPYRVREALRGIEGYSHLWLIWGFNATKGNPQDWTPTVRPPRLGGNKRMGVFATRSPYRPNRIGLSSVRLLRIEETKDEGWVLIVSGADMLNGTPIYDLKPYLSFSDAHPDALNGFAEETKDFRMPVRWSKDALPVLRAMSNQDKNALEEILSQDPRPAYQEDVERVYKMDYGKWNIQFRVTNDGIEVVSVDG